MSTRPCRAAVRRVPGVAVMDLYGEIDREAADVLAAAYQDAVRCDTSVVLLNFSGVNYINSTGIALLVELLRRTRASGRRIVGCGLTDHYRFIFEITRLADFMSVYPDEASAFDALAIPSAE